MPTRLSIAIPQPCQQDWAAMTPAAQGRHCAACDKVVVDFTQKTDAEILTLLTRAAAPCGRFRVEQLNRPLLSRVASAPPWRTWLAAAATVWGLREIAAQNAPAQQSAVLVRSSTGPVASLPVRSSRLLPAGNTTLRGRVLGTDAAGLGNATVQLADTPIQALTAADGSFALALTASSEATVVLTISAPGYKTHQMAVLLEPDSSQPIVINLQSTVQSETRMVLGGISAVRVMRNETSAVRSFDLWDAVRRATSRNP